MFRNFLLVFAVFTIFFGFSIKIIACNMELVPSVLLVTTFKNAQEKNSEDKIIYDKLKSIYKDNAVSAIFSNEDETTYISMLINLISKFNLKKIFILDSKFGSSLPKISSDSMIDTNLISFLQKYNNVDFYFFNNQIADSIKKSNNIYEFRFDSANKKQPDSSLNYGSLIASHFYKQLVDDSGSINTEKYNFFVDLDGYLIIKIGLINYIGNSYQQKILDDFKKALNEEKNIPKNTKYEFIEITPNILNSYNNNNVQLIEEIANRMFHVSGVNFILNSNNWYNNLIAKAIISSSSKGYTKTMKFIASSVLDKDAYQYKNVNNMLFSYNLDFKILKYSIDNKFNEDDEVIDTASEKYHSYGINNIIFVDGYGKE